MAANLEESNVKIKEIQRKNRRRGWRRKRGVMKPETGGNNGEPKS